MWSVIILGLGWINEFWVLTFYSNQLAILWLQWSEDTLFAFLTYLCSVQNECRHTFLHYNIDNRWAQLFFLSEFIKLTCGIKNLQSAVWIFQKRLISLKSYKNFFLFYKRYSKAESPQSPLRGVIFKIQPLKEPVNF